MTTQKELIHNCIVCNSSEIEFLLRLPNLPIISGCVDPEVAHTEKSRCEDLTIVFCNSCGLMFKDSPAVQEVGLNPYPGTTTIKSKIAQDEEFAQYVKKLGLVNLQSLLDIGCHDGHFLSLMQPYSQRVRGCEPSTYAQLARDNYGLEVDQALFSNELYSNGQFEVVTARNVLCTVRNPRKFLQDCNEVLCPGGLLVIENPGPSEWYSLRSVSFDHQAQWYFSSEHIKRLAEGADFHLTDTQEGRRMYLTFYKPTLTLAPARATLMKQYAEDYHRRFDKIKTYLEIMFANWRRDHLSVCIFGAGSHTQFILSMLDLQEDKSILLVDSDPAKQGKILAGSTMIVRPPSWITSEGTDIVLVSSGAYQDEIIEQLRTMQVNQIVAIYPLPTYILQYDAAQTL